MMSSALLVADMINDLVHKDGQTPYKTELVRTRAVENMAIAVAKARGANVPVIYIRIGFSTDYRECPKQSPLFQGAKSGLFKLGTWGTEIHPLLKPKEKDFDVVKHRVSPFYATSLEAIIGAIGADHLIIGGVSTGGAVLSAAKDGHDRDYRITILTDCCCAGSAVENDALMATMERYVKTTSSTELKLDS